MRGLKKFFERFKDFLPIVEGLRVHFTKEALIFLFVAICALLTAFYILGIHIGYLLSP